MIFVVSCHYDNEEELYGTKVENCGDSGNNVFTYAAAVQPILQNNCYECHSNSQSASSGGGIRLQEYADVKVRVNNGSLYGAITHSQGYEPMPQGKAKLDACTISVIKKWIDAGALNN